jgi:hypothetical protein
MHSNTAPIILFFGCLKSKGHFLYHPREGQVWGYRESGLPDKLLHSLDGTFCPPETELQRYLVSTVPPFTIISWWDRSVDQRPGSNSNFIFKGFGDASPQYLLTAAKAAFPEVFARQPELLPYLPT